MIPFTSSALFHYHSLLGARMFPWRTSVLLVLITLQLAVFPPRTVAAASDVAFSIVPIGNGTSHLPATSRAQFGACPRGTGGCATSDGTIDRPYWRQAQNATSENPSAVRKDDPDRQVTDVDQVICTALKSEYDKCDPACNQSCESLYDEARECPKVVHRCTR
jgi:hypothetical protein